jgi:BMFP domain-containing protein YqiC
MAAAARDENQELRLRIEALEASSPANPAKAAGGRKKGGAGSEDTRPA